MAWLRVESRFPHHRKIHSAGTILGGAGRGRILALWILGSTYAVEHLTDGFVPFGVLEDPRYDRKPADVIAAMITVQLLESATGGYQLHDFHDYNPSAADVKAKRKADLERKNSGGKVAESPKNRNGFQSDFNALAGRALRLIALLESVAVLVEKDFAKYAPMHSPHEGYSVIREKLDELWEHVRADTGRTPEAAEEGLHVAAMAVRYLYDLTNAPLSSHRDAPTPATEASATKVNTLTRQLAEAQREARQNIAFAIAERAQKEDAERQIAMVRALCHRCKTVPHDGASRLITRGVLSVVDGVLALIAEPSRGDAPAARNAPPIFLCQVCDQTPERGHAPDCPGLADAGESQGKP